MCWQERTRPEQIQAGWKRTNNQTTDDAHQAGVKKPKLSHKATLKTGSHYSNERLYNRPRGVHTKLYPLSKTEKLYYGEKYNLWQIAAALEE